MSSSHSKFELSEFLENNNVTHICLNDNDFLYIQIPEPTDVRSDDLEHIRKTAHKFFQWALDDYNIKFTVDFKPLKFTVISKKEEFVARLNDNIVQL